MQDEAFGVVADFDVAVGGDGDDRAAGCGGAVGGENGDAKWSAPGDQRQADGVVAGLKDQAELAVGDVDGFGWAGVETGGSEQDVCGRGEQQFGGEALDGDVVQGAGHGGGEQ